MWPVKSMKPLFEMSSLINVSLNSCQICSLSRTAWLYRSACTEAEHSGVKRGEEDSHFSLKKELETWILVWKKSIFHFQKPSTYMQSRAVDLIWHLPCVFCWRTNTLLEKVAAAVEQSAFYSALWGSILTSPAVRLPGVSFVLLHLNRKLSMEDQLYVMGNDIELMVYDGTL